MRAISASTPPTLQHPVSQRIYEPSDTSSSKDPLDIFVYIMSLFYVEHVRRWAHGKRNICIYIYPYYLHTKLRTQRRAHTLLYLQLIDYDNQIVHPSVPHGAECTLCPGSASLCNTANPLLLCPV